MYLNLLCLFALVLYGLGVIRLGIEHRAIDVEPRNQNAGQKARHVEFTAVDCTENDAQDAEKCDDHTPCDEFLAFSVHLLCLMPLMPAISWQMPPTKVRISAA